MARYRRGHRHGKRTTQDKAQVYTIRGRNNRINYVGSTNNPTRRAKEHERAGKRGRLVVETKPMSRPAARRREAKRLADYRKRHQGRNPRDNRTRSGGWRS